MPNISFDDIFTVLIILFTLFSVVSGAGKSMSKSQQEARRNAEIERRRRLAELESREADPNLQSYEGYLRRNERPNEGPFNVPPSGDVRQYMGQDDQEQLRKRMAEKMARPAGGRSFEDDLREAQARNAPPTARTAPPVARTAPPARPAARPTPRPNPRSLETRGVEARSLETTSAGPTSLEVMTSDMRSSLSDRRNATVEHESGRLRREVESVRAARDASLDRAAGGAAPAAMRSASSTREIGDAPVKRDTSGFSSRDIVHAFVMSEILGPPRSRHREPRR